MRLLYLDSSALVKLAVREVGSDALRHEVGGERTRRCSSIVGRIEFERAVRRTDWPDVEARIDAVLSDLDIVPFNIALAATASALRPGTLRSLDAIHLATVIAAREDLAAFYCYDQRLAEAAREHGIDVRSPGVAT